MRARVSRITVGLAVVASGAILITAADAQQKRKIKRPDLVVSSARYTGDSYLIQDEAADLSFTDRTRNIGSKKARPTYTVLHLSPFPPSKGFHHIGILGTYRAVPALKPRKASRGSAARTWKTLSGWLGNYWANVCSDAGNHVVEEDEDNNCKYTGDRVGIIPRRFVGTVHGSGPWASKGTVKDQWTATVTFAFASASGTGKYQYDIEKADVKWTTSGAESSCTYSGSGHATIVGGTGSLTLDYDAMTYFAAASVMPGVYQVAVTCGTHTSYQPGPGPGGIWLAMDPSAWPAITPSHHYTSLSDSYDCAPTCQNKWDWSLDAE